MVAIGVIVWNDEFVFTITEQTPTVGQLFEHTFVLTQEKSSMINEKQHQVSVFGDTQSFTTKSSSDIQSVNFIEGDESEDLKRIAERLERIEGLLQDQRPKPDD